MEEGAITDCVPLVREGEAALSDGVIEALDGVEAAVGERFVNEPPKMFGRLELGTVGRLEYETNAVGHGEVLGSVPAGIVELKHDALVVPGAYRSGKIDEDEFEQLLADGVGNVPHRLAGCRLDETGHIEPLETMMAESDQGVPPALVVDGSHPVELRKPARNLGPRPKPAIVRWHLDPLFESRQRLGR